MDPGFISMESTSGRAWGVKVDEEDEAARVLVLVLWCWEDTSEGGGDTKATAEDSNNISMRRSIIVSVFDVGRDCKTKPEEAATSQTRRGQ